MENITMGKSSPSIDHPTINSIRKERCGEIKQNTHNIRDNDDVEPSSDRNVLLWKTMEAKMMLWSDNSKGITYLFRGWIERRSLGWRRWRRGWDPARRRVRPNRVPSVVIFVRHTRRRRSAVFFMVKPQKYPQRFVLFPLYALLCFRL